MKTRFAAILLFAGFALFNSACLGAFDMTFYGNPNAGYNFNMLSGGSLHLTSGSSDSISATFTRGGSDSSQLNDNVVFFIDSQAGGFANSGTFTGSGNLGQAAAGFNGTGRSTAVFNSFGADYIIAFGANNGGAVFQIGSDGALNQVQSFTLRTSGGGPVGTGSRDFIFNFNWSSIGVADPQNGGFRFYSSLVGNTGARRQDSMESITGAAGFGNTITFNGYNLFGIDPVPEPTNVALAIFGGLAVTGGVVRKVTRRKLKS